MAMKIKMKKVTGRDPHISMPEVGKETRFCLSDWVHMIHFYDGLWLHICECGFPRELLDP
jgi:hypothetical protein